MKCMRITNDTTVTIERLDRVYCFMECKAVFLFLGDVADHQEMFGHKDKFSEVPL